MGCDKMLYTKVLTLPGGYTLPLRLTLERYYQVERETVPVDALCAQSVLEQYADAALAAQMVAGTVESRQTDFTREEGRFCLTQSALCTEMIARSAELPILEQEDRKDGTDH